MNKITLKLLEAMDKEYRCTVEVTKEEATQLIGAEAMENTGMDNGVIFNYVHLKWRSCKGKFIPTDYTPNGHSTKLHQVIIFIKDKDTIEFESVRHAHYIVKGDSYAK